MITVCSPRFCLLLLVFDIPELRPQLIHQTLKYQGVERPNLLGLFCRLRFECGMTFPTLILTLERWMGVRVQSTVGCFPELCFLQFSAAPVIMGLRKQFINNFVFPTWACAAGFNNNNNNNNNTWSDRSTETLGRNKSLQSARFCSEEAHKHTNVRPKPRRSTVPGQGVRMKSDTWSPNFPRLFPSFLVLHALSEINWKCDIFLKVISILN